ncbi:MAG: transcriptional regulator, IclR family [Pseudomonadota bacterium]
MTTDAKRSPPAKPAPARAPAVTRAISILKVLGESSHPLGVNAIARAIDAVPSSCLHILRALVEEGMVHVDGRTKQYSLGLGLLMLARDMAGRSQFAQAVQPELERLARDHSVTATAVEMDARERLVVVALAQAPTLWRLQVGLGVRVPAFISATGRCVAAYSGLDNAELASRFSRLKWDSPPDVETWLAEVKLARSTGIAVDVGQYTAGLTVVAALLPPLGDERQSVSVVGLSDKISSRDLARLKRATRVAALRVAGLLDPNRTCSQLDR